MDSWLRAWGVGSVAFGATSLLVPLYLVALGGGALALGWLASLAALAGLPGALVGGRIADRTGRRRAFVVGPLAVTGLALVVLPAVRSIPGVLAVNAVVWLAFAAAGPALNLLAVADVEEAAWSDRLGELNAVQGYGWAAGLGLGLVWTTAAGRLVGPLAGLGSLAVACGVVALGATVAAGVRLPTRGPGPQGGIRGRRLARAIQRASRSGIRGATFPAFPARLYWGFRGVRPRRVVDRFTPRLATYYVAVLLFFTGFAAFFAPLPLYLADAGFGEGDVFAVYLASSVGAALFFTRAGRLVGRYGPTPVQAAGLLARGVLLPVVAVLGALDIVGARAVGVAAALLGGIGVTWAVISVSAATLVTRLAPAPVRGEALGVYAALAAVAGTVGGVLGGWLAGTGYPAAFTVAGGLVALAGGVVVALDHVGARPAAADPDGG